jgi:glutamine synthetase
MEINGSGKHANWSLGYVDADGKVKNLFAVPKKEEDVKLFQLFILITLSALKNHNALYFASVAPPGNEIRLGGHEAPPRIISAYLGATVNAIVDGVAPPVRKNLKENLPFLPEDIFQEDTDRNRTSAFPYTGQKFEFRALGSSQNAAWPMAVISATLAKEMQVVEQKIDQGATIDQLIEQLREDTRPVRFDGNGYSH